MLNKEGIRELCYVVRVDKITPIEGANNVELSHVLGWQCMTRKGQFKEGDLAIYFEIDSKVEEKEPFLFLDKKHFKIKTQKYLKGTVLSQGLLMSPADFGWSVIDDTIVTENKEVYRLNDGLTKRLNVTYAIEADNVRKAKPVDKYKRMTQLYPDLFKNKFVQKLYGRSLGKKLLFIFFGKKAKANGFPTKFTGVSKTDQERIENEPWILTTNKNPFIKTCKIDGTSATYILEKKHFGYEYYVLSRNVRQLDRNTKNYHSDNENVYWQVSDKYKIKEFLKEYIQRNKVRWVCLQGEIAGITQGGVKIQGNPHKLKDLRFFGFHLTDSVNDRIDVIKAKNCCNDFGIEWCPIVDDNYILPDNLEEFKLSADGKCDIEGSSGLREGFVYYEKSNPRNSFKNVSIQYLLKHS